MTVHRSFTLMCFHDRTLRSELDMYNKDDSLVQNKTLGNIEKFYFFYGSQGTFFFIFILLWHLLDKFGIYVIFDGEITKVFHNLYFIELTEEPCWIFKNHQCSFLELRWNLHAFHLIKERSVPEFCVLCVCFVQVWLWLYRRRL